nr:SpoIIE family protein phosphatase [Solirubrobacterales bacterium]
MSGELPNVLLVDDRSENLLALEAVLAPLACRTVSVDSGAQALKALLLEEFALILLDVQMPDLDGFETARYIRQRERTRTVPIIFVTAISKEPSNVYLGYEAGAVDYLFKPFDAHVLCSKVQVFLELHAQRRLLARSEAMLRRTFDHAPIGMARLDVDEVILDVNRAFAETLGRTPEALRGHGLRSLLHPDDREGDDVQRQALREGRLQSYDVGLRLVDAQQDAIPCLLSVSTLPPIDGEGPALLVQAQDMRERRRAEAEREALVREQAARRAAEWSSGRMQALQRVTDGALASLELEPLLDELLRRLIEALDVDVAAALLPEEPGQVTVFQVGAPESTPAQRRVLHPDEDGLLARVAAAGSILVSDPRDVAHPFGDAVATLLSVPLGGAGAPLGALVVGSLFARDFAPDDRDLLALAGERAALGIERARVFEREHSIAQQLQRSLLPAQLPGVPGLVLSARYRPGSAGTEVGGDWYDTVALPGERLLLVMGDIAGKGVGAAATMGQLRSAVRAYALVEDDPRAIAGRLNTFVASLAVDTMATLVLAVVDLAEGTVRQVNAGHPPPLLVEADGTRRYLRRALGVPLGALADPRYEQDEVAFGLGATLLL